MHAAARGASQPGDVLGTDRLARRGLLRQRVATVEQASGSIRLVWSWMPAGTRPMLSASANRPLAPSPSTVSVSSASRVTVRRRMRRSISSGASVAAFQSGPHTGFGSSSASTVSTAP